MMSAFTTYGCFLILIFGICMIYGQTYICCHACIHVYTSMTTDVRLPIYHAYTKNKYQETSICRECRHHTYLNESTAAKSTLLSSSSVSGSKSPPQLRASYTPPSPGLETSSFESLGLSCDCCC